MLVENLLEVRPATRADVPVIEELIAQSARVLSEGYYTATQVESLLRMDRSSTHARSRPESEPSSCIRGAHEP